MRYPASEKLEIIRLVEGSQLSARLTLAKLGIPRTTFYRWYDRYLQRGDAGLQDQSPKPKHVWNRIPDEVRRKVVKLALKETELSPRELAVTFTDKESYFVSEASTYRILKAHDLITSPAFIVIKAASEFKDILPMVMLSQQLGPEYDNVPLLVPSHILESPNFRDSFAIFRGDRPIISLDPDRCYEVGEMVAIPSPVYGPFNSATFGWPQPDQYLQNVTILKHFREQILKAFAPRNETSASPQRVFLSRPSGKRSYNQDELEVIARREGFAIVSPETLSFGEQVRLFNNADVIVGASGAAWACSLFMKLGSKALIWAPIEASGGCFFSNLALVSGSDVSYQFIKSAVPLKSTYEAHQQSYTVPLDEFSHHLSILCDNGITLHGSV